MAGRPTAWRRLYGDRVLHLLLLAAAFALTGYALSVLGWRNLWNPQVWWQSIAVWFAGAVIAHDLVAFPVYALADRLLGAVGSRVRRRGTGGPPDRVWVNYVRVPTMAAVLTLLLFLPGILEQGSVTYTAATGLTQEPFLRRWLLLVAAFYGVSAVVLVAVTLRRRVQVQ